jgi:FtsP/CotA-like multicopper oxidase with cupredoxin domain
MTRWTFRLLVGLALAAALGWGASQNIRAAARSSAAAMAAPASATDTAAPAAAAAAQQTRTKKKATSTASQTVVTDALGRQHVLMKKVTPADRKAAAARLRARVGGARTTARTATTAATTAPAAAAPATMAANADAAALAAPMAAAPMAAAVALPGAIPKNQLLVDKNGQLIPDYSGLTPHWAYSPTPSGAPGTAMQVGNSLTARGYATDTANNVFGILPGQLPAGTLQSFRIFGAAGAAGMTFHAYILRPSTVPGDYAVIYDSGPLAVAGTNAIEEFPAAAGVTVNANDVIGWYGQGIALDIGTGTDALYYPSPAAPVQGSTITAGGVDYPSFVQPRTYSLAAVVTSGGLVGGIRKFVDGLPGLNTPNNLGQQIPVGVPQGWPLGCVGAACTADYYEIELGEYSEQMHSDLPPTRLRGYRQTNGGNGSFHYLGPLIVAQKGRPVRVKFTNNLPTGAAGNLFLPVDASVMGSGPGPNVSDTTRLATPPNDLCKAGPNQVVPAGCYTQNRATIHLHGGVTPWISDGTTHQWITPAGESTQYPNGVSVHNVPDMPNPGKPGSASNPAGSGSMTFYYTNDQSARLMFYHDHAAGITRLNVYAGQAAGYLIQDPTELELVAKGVIPADQVPLVIQDKTFVDAANIEVQDPTWNWGTGSIGRYTDARGVSTDLRAPVTGDLWWPHVYVPAQNPYDLSGYNAMGRWNYGPWFYPPTTGIQYGPVDNPYCGVVGGPCTDPAQTVKVPGTPNPSWGAEAFLDTPVINGTLYPTLTVEPKAYRFRILNAAHDRFWNLQLYQAFDKKTDTTAGGTGPAPVACTGGAVPLADCTEVKMVPAAPNTGLPANWAMDGRDGGAPDPKTMGPDFIQIGTEGGFLPRPVVVPNQPVLWNNDPLTFNFGNVSDHAVLVGPAERVDVIVDFSKYAGQTLILYNDAPAAFPAADPRNDYYTGNPDQTDTGGTVSTLPGYGPNTRTLMQIHVNSGTPAPFDLAKLQTAWMPGNTGYSWSPAGVFEHAQDPIIVGQQAYNGTYTSNPTFRSDLPWSVGTIFDSHVSFETVAGDQVTLLAQPKAIHDEMGATFDEYGRMKASLGVSIDPPIAGQANFVGQGYADPATEVIKLTDFAAVPVGAPLVDGTQIWRLTHNGVDTHPIHFHLFHVQLINRVGWDGAYRLPDETELGWKDTVRVSPLEDTYVALRPIAPAPATLPFKIPNSHRPLEPALPIGSQIGFSNLDMQGQAITPAVTNQVQNFGWEYIWHCHILSHEENDMMRAIVFTAPPEAPASLALASPRTASGVPLRWTDMSVSALNFRIERSTNANFTTVTAIPVAVASECGSQGGCVRTFTDSTAAATTAYFYRVRASNTVGSSVPNFPTVTVDSAWSNTLSVPAPAVTVTAPSNLTATIASATSVQLSWRDNSNNENTFTIFRSTNGGTATAVGTVNRNNGQRTGTGGTVNFTNTGLTAGNTYAYYVVANATGGSSGPSNTVTVVFALPAAPTGLAGSAVRITGNLLQDRVTLTWLDNAANETGFQVQRATNAAFTANVNTFTAGANATSFTQTVVRTSDFYYRVRATNGVGNSAWSNVVFVVTP